MGEKLKLKELGSYIDDCVVLWTQWGITTLRNGANTRHTRQGASIPMTLAEYVMISTPGRYDVILIFRIYSFWSPMEENFKCHIFMSDLFRNVLYFDTGKVYTCTRGDR